MQKQQQMEDMNVKAETLRMVSTMMETAKSERERMNIWKTRGSYSHGRRNGQTNSCLKHIDMKRDKRQRDRYQTAALDKNLEETYHTFRFKKLKIPNQRSSSGKVEFFITSLIALLEEDRIIESNVQLPLLKFLCLYLVLPFTAGSGVLFMTSSS